VTASVVCFATLPPLAEAIREFRSDDSDYAFGMGVVFTSYDGGDSVSAMTIASPSQITGMVRAADDDETFGSEVTGTESDDDGGGGGAQRLRHRRAAGTMSVAQLKAENDRLRAMLARRKRLAPP
jgi:hypothetical protein